MLGSSSAFKRNSVGQILLEARETCTRLLLGLAMKENILYIEYFYKVHLTVNKGWFYRVRICKGL